MSHFQKFRSAIQETSDVAIRKDPTLAGRLTIHSDGDLLVSYAPFEHIQLGAKLVIVGITPGAQQAANALCSARRDILAGLDEASVLARAKVYASFSGPMRTNLISMMDHVGLNRHLGIASTATLWSQHSAMAHFTSAQRFPIFLTGKNYAGNPRMVTTPILRRQLDDSLAEEAAALPDAIWIPLGPKAAEGLAYVAGKGLINAGRILDGLQHPSGANNERIAYFLGRNTKLPSSKTNPLSIDAGKAAVVAKVAALSAV